MQTEVEVQRPWLPFNLGLVEKGHLYNYLEKTLYFRNLNRWWIFISFEGYKSVRYQSSFDIIPNLISVQFWNQSSFDISPVLISVQYWYQSGSDISPALTWVLKRIVTDFVFSKTILFLLAANNKIKISTHKVFTKHMSNVVRH